MDFSGSKTAMLRKKTKKKKRRSFREAETKLLLGREKACIYTLPVLPARTERDLEL